MKVIRMVVAVCAVLAATTSVAQANLILVGGTPTASFTDLGAAGFGNRPRLLTLQTDDLEAGGAIPNGDVENPTLVGQAIDGTNKTTTPIVSTLGWTSGSQVGVGFNSGQTGNSGITLQTLVLTIYNSAFAAVDSFALASPITFTEAELGLQQGNGQAVFNFALDAAQQAEFDLVLAANPGTLYAGLNSSLGCVDGAKGEEPSCAQANDGPDSFLAFAQSEGTPVPDGGATMTLLGSALVGLGLLRRKLRG